MFEMDCFRVSGSDPVVPTSSGAPGDEKAAARGNPLRAREPYTQAENAQRATPCRATLRSTRPDYDVMLRLVSSTPEGRRGWQGLQTH